MKNSDNQKISIISEYLDDYLCSKNLNKIIKKVKKSINSKLVFDSIAFRGMSGALLAPTLAIRLNKQLIMVRKKTETHSGLIVEGNLKSKKYIIVDDFIDSGLTVANILMEIKRVFPRASCQGILLAHGGFRPEFIPIRSFKKRYMWKNLQNTIKNDKLQLTAK